MLKYIGKQELYILVHGLTTDQNGTRGRTGKTVWSSQIRGEADTEQIKQYGNLAEQN